MRPIWIPVFTRTEKQSTYYCLHLKVVRITSNQASSTAAAVYRPYQMIISHCPLIRLRSCLAPIPFRTAVPFWGQTSQIMMNLSPKWDGGSKGAKDVDDELL